MSILLLVLLHPVPVITIHGILTRLLRERLSHQLTAALAALAGTVLASAYEARLELSRGRLDALTVLYVAFATACSGYCYFHVFNMTETSRRVKLLSLRAARGGRAAEGAETVYDVDEILRIRLRRLERLGQIRRVGSRYVLRGRSLLAASAAVRLLQRLLGFDKAYPSKEARATVR